MGDVELVDVGPEHDFCHFETLALGAGGTERSFNFLSTTPQGGLLEIPYPSEFYFSEYQIQC